MAHTRTAPHVAARFNRFFMFGLGALPWLAALFMLLAAGVAQAQDDPPGRVGRLANLQGPVSWFDPDEGRWQAADRNRPLTSGDRIATGAESRAELRVGSSVLRLGAATELEVLRLDDDRMVWQLHSGSLALRVRNRDAAQETELVTGEVRLQPDRAGHYRLDRIDDSTLAGVWRGALRVQEPGADWIIEAGQRQELWRERARWNGELGALRQRSSRVAEDPFASWVLAEDRSEDGRAAYRYVSPEMTGAEDLDRHGRWEQHPEHGAMWLPAVTVADWAPYRHGRWAWVRPWGWTWVDDARWGFAPFHYGRWVNWRGRWGWCPGAYEARPVYAPALVAWVGGPRLAVSVSIGLPAVAWVPLAPRERYVPHHRHSPVYERRLNVHAPHHSPLQVGPAQRPGHGPVRPDRATGPMGPDRAPGPMEPDRAPGPIGYTNQGVPGAVTVVPRDVLLQRQPVAREVLVDLPAALPQRGTRAPGAAWEAVTPPVVVGPQRPSPSTAPLMGAEPTHPARGPSVAPPVQAPAGGGSLPSVQQPPQPARQTTPPLAPAAPALGGAAPADRPAPRLQVLPTEPAAPMVEGRRRDARAAGEAREAREAADADRRRNDAPPGSYGPQRPLAPARPGPAPEVNRPAASPPAPAAPAAAPARPAAPAAAAVPTPSVSPSAAPSPATVPALVAPAARADRPAVERPSRPERADLEEGRKRGPGNRERENLR